MLSLQEIITATGGHCENMQELIFTMGLRLIRGLKAVVNCS